MKPNLFHAIAAVLVAASARAEMVAVEWDGAGRFHKAVPVPAGKFVEACEALPRGARVNWSFEAGAALDFNVHYHADKDVVFPVRKDQAVKASGTLVATLDQEFCWMWTNRGAKATTLRLELARAGAAR